MANKTIPVLTLLEKANHVLSQDFSPSRGANEHTCLDTSTEHERARAYRLGVCGMIETVLHATGNYAGFGYLDTPFQTGVTDESRRVYYYSDTLRFEKAKKG
jgi:hypothetical protein